MDFRSKWRAALEIILWPVNFVKFKILLPILVRRAIHRFNMRTTKPVTYRTILGVRLVLKISWSDTAIIEAKTLRYVSRNTTIPVPVVYDYVVRPSGIQQVPDLGVIVMGRLPGKTLRSLWKKLSDAQKTHVFERIRSYVMQLRSLPQSPPVGRIASLAGHLYDERLDDHTFGPFENEEEFNNWRLSTFEGLAERIDSEELRDAMQRYRLNMPLDHPIVFTHGDLHLQNVLVDLRGPEPQDAHVVAIIDWEMSAWMPAYWEPIKMVYGQSDLDWRDLVEETFPGFDTEMALDLDLMFFSGKY